MLHSVSGLMALTGECGGGPVQLGQPVADPTLGLWIAIGLPAARPGCDATDLGVCIDFPCWMVR